MLMNYNWKPHEKRADMLLRRSKTPGTALGLALHGKPVYFRGYGYADLSLQREIDEDTVFGIGSVTKSITAVAIMQLQERGLLSVSDSITRYLPEFRYGREGAEKAMTIHHFLTHTTGIQPLPSLMRAVVRSLWKDELLMKDQGEKLGQLPPIDTETELMSFIAEQDLKLLGYPGEYFSYSNDCYSLLGTIISRVSGKGYEDYVKDHIFKPLGMSRSFFSAEQAVQTDNVATLYSSKGFGSRKEVFASPVWVEAPAQVAAGFIKSTIGDMLRYMDIYRTGGRGTDAQILSEKSVKQMCTPYAQPLPGQFYGYGLDIVSNHKGYSIVEHGGNIKGVAAWVSCVREAGITGVALSNLTPSPVGEVLLSAINTVLGIPVTTSRRRHFPYQCPPEYLADYAGEYVSGEGIASLNIKAISNGLEFHVAGAKLRARPTGVDTFALRREGLDSTVRFVRDKTGEVWALCFGYRMIPRS
jgi:CubicO group peptidase (beta-lactamase class C family)